MVAITSIALGATLLGLGVTSVVFIQELTNLIQLIINNTFYLSLLAVTAGLGGLILYRLVSQERISVNQAGLGFIIVVLATLSVPVAGVEIGQAATTYKADLTVTTDQFTGAPVGGLDKIEYSSLSVDNVERTGPSIINPNQNEACIFCGDWTVQTTVTCNNGQFSKDVTLTGPGGGSDTVTVRGMPADSQCRVEGQMTSPEEERRLGQNPKVTSFSTGP